MYGIKPRQDEDDASDGEGNASLDIEDQIQKDLEKMKSSSKPRPRHVFSVVHVDIECVFFVKTMKPVEPRELVLKICRDARACSSPTERKLKYVNRLSPVTDTDKATENGIVRVAQAVVSPYLALRDDPSEKAGAQLPSGGEEKAKEQAQAADDKTPHTVRNEERGSALIGASTNTASPSLRFAHRSEATQLSNPARSSRRLRSWWTQSTRSTFQSRTRLC